MSRASRDWDRATVAQRAWMIGSVLSSGTMDQEKIKRLLETIDQQDQVKLKVLHNAVVKCIQDYRTDSTSSRLNDWQKAEGALDSFVETLWSERFEEEKTLPNLKAVVDHLKAQGWRAGQSTIYKHNKEAKLRPQANGSFRIADVEKYAASHLKRLDGSQSKKLDRLQEDKLSAEAQKLKAQAEHWVVKARVASGQYVERALFEQELAKRAARFRNDLESFCHAMPDRIVALVGGDANKAPDLIVFMLGQIEQFLAHYAEEREFIVPLPKLDDDSDDEGE